MFDFKNMTSKKEKALGISYTRTEIYTYYLAIALMIWAIISEFFAKPLTIGFEFAMLLGFYGLLILGIITINARTRRIKELMTKDTTSAN